MAYKLRSCNSDTEILECAARIHSSGSFLYKLLSETLREVDMSELDTLGPFFFLLWLYLNGNNGTCEHLLHRGTSLTINIIEAYKKAVETYVYCSAFISTTKDRAVAEMFSGNTLFIIQIEDNIDYPYQRFIAPVSQYLDEEEVLLTITYPFTIDNVERDTASGKWLLYLT